TRLQTVPGVKDVDSDVNMKIKTSAGSKDGNLDLKCGTGDFMKDSKIKLVHGRELNESELNQAIPAVILNEEAFNKLCSGWESNQYTDIKGKTDKIVGVYETKKDFGMPMPDGYKSLANDTVMSGVTEYTSISVTMKYPTEGKSDE
ncbi:ABC transporter permease, partial [Bacillus sp. S1-R4H1-FB]|uniref:ABC transporter permease n=1 Tax=Bacillus sp. S1-R4H1-FB TaxID=1973492 RepID=UPI00111F5BB7